MKDFTIEAVPYILTAPLLIAGFLITYAADVPFDWWIGGGLTFLGFDKILDLIGESLKDRYIK